MAIAAQPVDFVKSRFHLLTRLARYQPNHPVSIFGESFQRLLIELIARIRSSVERTARESNEVATMEIMKNEAILIPSGRL